jgi:hypothetical protein
MEKPKETSHPPKGTAIEFLYKSIHKAFMIGEKWKDGVQNFEKRKTAVSPPAKE